MLLEAVPKGAEEHRRRERASPYKKRSKRWDLSGEDERAQNLLRVEMSKAMAQVVRRNHKVQIWFEQQQIVKRIKDLGLFIKSRDEETPSS